MTDNRNERERSGAKRTRASDDTKTNQRPAMSQWSPASALAMPKINGDYRLRWITEYVNGVHTPRNVQTALREGYERVPVSDFTETFICDEDIHGDGFARTGGLILMKIPNEFAEQREAYYRSRSADALSGANTLQGVAGSNAVYEDRGTRSLSGSEAGAALRNLNQ